MDCDDNLLDKNKISEILKMHGTGYRSRNDPFFEDGNKLVSPFIKLGVQSKYPTDNNDIDVLKDTGANIQCNVPSCQKVFSSINEYESHYKILHQYSCHICKKNIPSAHLLDLHVSEEHDSFFAVLAAKKPMYQCFLTECDHKSVTPEERHNHCIKNHKFPRKFRFDTYNNRKSSIKFKNHNNKNIANDVENGNSNSSSSSSSSSSTESNCRSNKMLNNEDNKTNSENIQEVTNETLTTTQKFKYFNFGHSNKRTFLSKIKINKTENTNIINKKPTNASLEEMSVDLLQSLPE